MTSQTWVEFVRREDRREDHTMFGVLRVSTDDAMCSFLALTLVFELNTCGLRINGAEGRQSSRRQTAWR